MTCKLPQIQYNSGNNHNPSLIKENKSFSRGNCNLNSHLEIGHFEKPRVLNFLGWIILIFDLADLCNFVENSRFTKKIFRALKMPQSNLKCLAVAKCKILLK